MRDPEISFDQIVCVALLAIMLGLLAVTYQAAAELPDFGQMPTHQLYLLKDGSGVAAYR